MDLSKFLHRNVAVLGIDASTKTIAFCAMTEDGTPVAWGEMTLGDGDMYNRLGYAFTFISKLLDSMNLDENNIECYIESAVKINNIKTTINLSYMYGIIIGALRARGIKVHEVSPITWQNYIGNKSLTAAEKQAFADQYRDKSRATVKNKIRMFRKKRTLEWVKRKFGIELQSDNVADAVGVAWYAIHH